MENMDLILLKNKRLFITGHTGFKGSWLVMFLHKLGAIQKGYALSPLTRKSLFDEAHLEEIIDSELNDIRNLAGLKKSLSEFKPQIVIHLAAQPLVLESYKDPINNYTTNINGTINLLEACREIPSIKAILVITTDKVYRNEEINRPFIENDFLGGLDPYSCSKSCCELIVDSYRSSFYSNKSSPVIATARAGNVIGGGDWSENRIIPDILHALNTNQKVKIRNPESTRPWQHVLEPLTGYCQLLIKLLENRSYEGSWNFGPNIEDCWSVQEILRYIEDKTKKNLGSITNSTSPYKESKFLSLSIDKAKINLSWEPKWKIQDALDDIISWNNTFYEGKDIREICFNTITNYLKL